MSHLLTILVAVVHLLAAAGWVGAMGYSLIVVQPRSAAFYAAQPEGDEQLEQFVSTLARGQRWPVLSALGTLAVTGVVLAVLARPVPIPAAWVAAVSVKTACTLAGLSLFGHVSWRLWPTRVFALPAERPALRRRFRRAGLALLVLGVTASAAGVVASFAR